MDNSKVVWRGLLAGLLAAIALVLWFFIVGVAVTGHLFRRPSFLVDLLSQQGPARGGLVVLFALLHLGVLLGLGVLAAVTIRMVQPRGLFLLGIAVGLFFFAITFWGAVATTGIDVAQVLGWPALLGGSVLAGLVIVATLYFSGVARPGNWFGALGENEVLRQGIIAGLIGAVVVAVWFLIFDSITRVVFYTPAALGSALFFDAAGPAGVQVTTGAVLAYTLIHFAAFLLVGIIVAAFFHAAESTPALLLVFVLFFVSFEVMVIGFLTLGAIWILETLGWWSVAIANFLAALSILAYIWRVHPHLKERLSQGPLDEPL